MDIDFLEIGTSNFDTLIQTCDDSQTGISVDAIKYYLDCLPNKPNVKKIHTAITSDRKSDSIEIYYIPEDVIISNNLYDWVKGCNKIGDFHPLHKSHNVTHLVKVEKVPLVNIDEFLVENNVRKIKYLKIDTEGHDCVILNGLFKYLETKSKEYYPDKILFETNSNISDQDITNTIYYAIHIGYTCVSRELDTVLELS